MNIKLLKIVRSVLKDDFYYADFEIEEFGMVIKAMRYNSRNKRLTLPFCRTTQGNLFSPVTFPNPERHLEIIGKMKELIESQPLPTQLEQCDDETKTKIIRQNAERRGKAELLEKMGRPSPGFKKNKGFKSSFPNNRRQAPPARVWVRPGAKTNGEMEIPRFSGEGFTEIPLPNRKY